MSECLTGRLRRLGRRRRLAAVGRVDRDDVAEVVLVRFNGSISFRHGLSVKGFGKISQVVTD